jgi:hypothetical protein
MFMRNSSEFPVSWLSSLSCRSASRRPVRCQQNVGRVRECPPPNIAIGTRDNSIEFSIFTAGEQAAAPKGAHARKSVAMTRQLAKTVKKIEQGAEGR